MHIAIIRFQSESRLTNIIVDDEICDLDYCGLLVVIICIDIAHELKEGPQSPVNSTSDTNLKN